MTKKDRSAAATLPARPSAIALASDAVSNDLMTPPLSFQPEDVVRRHGRRLRTICELTAADPARIYALAHAFVKANDIDLQQLRQLGDKEDRMGLRHLAHRIKGAAQMTGDTQLVAVCTELSQLCVTPKATPHQLYACIQDMEHAMREFGESFQRMARDASPKASL